LSNFTGDATTGMTAYYAIRFLNGAAALAAVPVAV